MEKIRILGVAINNVSLAESTEMICSAVQEGRKLRIVTANPEMLYRAAKDERFQRVINSAELVVPDGIGVIWAASLLGMPLKERVTGADLTERILAAGNERGWKIFLLGAKPGVAQQAAAVQGRKYPHITFAVQHGYFKAKEEGEIIERITKFQPDILLAGLGSPAQEYWLHKHAGLARVSMGVGGTIDILSGRVKRAPDWMQKQGLEWLYRLCQEPSRLGRQKILPLYVLKVLKEKYSRQRSVFEQ